MLPVDYKIYKDGLLVNTIRASPEFIANYCGALGCTYEPEEREEENTPVLSTEERLMALEAENKELRAKLAAAVESGAMLEDCIVEMAGVVYA